MWIFFVLDLNTKKILNSFNSCGDANACLHWWINSATAHLLFQYFCGLGYDCREVGDSCICPLPFPNPIQPQAPTKICPNDFKWYSNTKQVCVYSRCIHFYQGKLMYTKESNMVQCKVHVDRYGVRQCTGHRQSKG